MINLGLSMLWYWSGYIVITLIGIGHTVFNWKVLGMENEDKTKEVNSFYDIDAYAKTVPYHSLYNIIIWPIFAYIYLVQVAANNIWYEAFMIGLTWTAITILFDLVAWVLIKHPWSMTFKEMYIDYQPWITLIYISIFISPFISVASILFQ